MKNLTSIFAALVFAAASTSAHALVIDEFNTTQSLFTFAAAPSTVTSEVGGALDSTILGGYRDITVNKIVGSAGISYISSAEATAGGLLAVQNGPSTNSIVTVAWDGAGSSGLGGFDLTSGGATAFDLGVYSADHDTVLNFVATSSSGTSTFQYVFLSDYTTPAAITLNFSGFAGAADLTSLDSLVMQISNTTALDAEFDYLRTNSSSGSGSGSGGGSGSGSVVPEPPVSLLFLAGLGVMGATLRSRKSPQAV